jgi:hypothetical protein
MGGGGWRGRMAGAGAGEAADVWAVAGGNLVEWLSGSCNQCDKFASFSFDKLMWESNLSGLFARRRVECGPGTGL